MDIILMAGLWLESTAWDQVAAELKTLGHNPIPVALPGVDDGSRDATLEDQASAALAAVDAASRPVVVGHSAACTLAWIVADRRPDSIHSVVLVGGFPAADGDTYAEYFEIVDGVMPFPGWGPFEGPDSDDIDKATKDRLAADAVPVPEGVAKGTVALGDDRRYEVPIIMVCPEYSVEDAKAWVDSGELPELARAAHLSYVNIDSGHWPMFTKPSALANILHDIST